MSDHGEWVRQIDAELDGELTLVERAALARHLVSCAACAGARASHLEVRVALARAAGEPQARAVPRPAIRGRSVALWLSLTVLAGVLAGWFAHAQWGRPGPGSLEASRAAFVVP